MPEHYLATLALPQILFAKKVKQELATTLGTNPKKLVIIINVEGVPLIPRQHQWLVALKAHTFKELDMTKPIDCQNTEKMEKLKNTLEKQF